MKKLRVPRREIETLEAERLCVFLPSNILPDCRFIGSVMNSEIQNELPKQRTNGHRGPFYKVIVRTNLAPIKKLLANLYNVTHCTVLGSWRAMYLWLWLAEWDGQAAGVVCSHDATPLRYAAVNKVRPIILAPCRPYHLPAGRSHQVGAEEMQGGRNFWKQILTDHFIVTQNSCKRVCFFAKKRRNSVKSNAAVRLVSNVRWTRFACRAVVIDRRCGRSLPLAAMLSMTKSRYRETEIS